MEKNREMVPPRQGRRRFGPQLRLVARRRSSFATPGRAFLSRLTTSSASLHSWLHSIAPFGASSAEPARAGWSRVDAKIGEFGTRTIRAKGAAMRTFARASHIGARRNGRAAKCGIASHGRGRMTAEIHAKAIQRQVRFFAKNHERRAGGLAPRALPVGPCRSVPTRTARAEMVVWLCSNHEF